MDSRDSRSSTMVDPRIAFFDDLAPRWDVTGPDPGSTLQRLVEHSELLGLRPGDALLEVGCGTGQITGWLAEQVAPGRVVGVDFAPAMLAQARQRGPGMEFQRADVCRDSLGDACFDVALCFHSFPHFRDPLAALKNLSRALRPGGRLLVMHLAGSAQINAFHSQVGGVVGGDRLPEADAWPLLLTGGGFEIEHQVDREDLFFLSAQRVANDSIHFP